MKPGSVAALFPSARALGAGLVLSLLLSPVAGRLGGGSFARVARAAAVGTTQAARTVVATETDGNTTLTISATRKPTFTAWKLEQPSRVVLDVNGARLGAGEGPFDAGTYAVGAVSATTTDEGSGPRTRVVLTLRRPADYQVVVQGNDLLVRVVPHERPAAAVAAKAPALTDDAQQKALTTVRADLDEARRGVEAERLTQEKRQVESMRRDLAVRAQVLARTQTDMQMAQAASLEAQQRAELALRKAEAVRLAEEARGNEVVLAAARVETRRQLLEAKFAAQEVERQKLDEAIRLVGQRESAVAAAASALAERQRVATLALARRTEAEKTGLSEAARVVALREQQLAEQQRQMAADIKARSRKELDAAVAGRQKEELRVSLLQKERVGAEERYRRAAAAAATEDSRRLAAEKARRAEEDRLVLAQARVRELTSQAQAIAQAQAPAPTAKRAREMSVARISAPAAAPTVAPTVATVLATAVAPLQPPLPLAPHAPSVTLRVLSQVQRIDFVDEPSRCSVIIDLDEPSAFSVQRQSSHRLTLRLLHADLPRGLQRQLDATEYLGPVRTISSYRQDSDRSVLVDVELAQEVPNQIRQSGSRLYWDFQKPRLGASRAIDGHTGAPGLAWAARPGGATARVRSLPWRSQVVAAPQFGALRLGPLAATWGQAAATTTIGTQFSPARPGAKKHYVGRRIDLNMKSADIHNLLRLLSDFGGVNIVLSDDVKGEVTIKMNDVPWDQALDIILRAKLLGQVREGNLIRVAPLQVLEKELEQEIARQKQATDVMPTETRLIAVSYADAKALMDKARDLLSQRGKISVDDRTNTMIVSDVGKNLSLVEELVRNLDTQTSMVVIEARIVEARSTFVRQLGVQWGGTGFADAEHGNPTGLAFPFNVGVGGGASDTTTPVNGLVPSPRTGTASANPNFAVNLPVAAGTGSGGALGFTFGSVAGAFNLNLRLSALENNGQVRILSSPRVSTLDNKEALIETGVSIPISVVSAQGVQTVFVQANLSLQVKPHVTNEGTVTMELNVTRDEPDFVNTGARGDPTILKKTVKTQLLVRDGDTAVIGGISQRNSGLNYAKVPFFADIPIVGALFRNRRENDDRSEFLVFLTPRIANRARALGQ